MFGLFKKKHTDTETKKFVSKLAQVASDFEFGISAIDKMLSEEFMSRALNFYLENNSEEAEYTPSDFFLNSFIGTFGHATVDGNMSTSDSLAVFSMTDHFLRGHPNYHTDFAIKLMNSWQKILIKMGAIK
jgi:hypothetical protein